MRDYEVVYIFKSSLTGEEIEDRLARYHEKILAAPGAEITAVEHWGKRQLAYPIDRNENGYYVVTQFSTDPAVLPDYERLLKLDEDLLRYLVVLSEGELPVPPSARSEVLPPVGRKEREAEDEDEDEEDEDEEVAESPEEEIDDVEEMEDGESMEDAGASREDARDDEAEE